MKNRESQDRKEIEKVKKTYKLFTTNNNCGGGNKGQLDDILSQSFRRDSCLNYRGLQSQSNILITSGNITTIKKNKKQDSNKDFDLVKYYTYYKKSNYINKYSDKKPKNQCQS